MNQINIFQLIKHLFKMRILPEKLKPFSTEITPECQRLIAEMRSTGDTAKFIAGLDTMTEWCSTFGKTEMGRWVEVLNDCDAILEKALEEDQQGTFLVDRDESFEAPVLSVLRFTSLLFENTFSRSIYASMEWLLKLLDCRKMWVLVQALRLLMIISKSSRFISQHISPDTRAKLCTKLMAILEAWSGRLRTIPVNEFCSDGFTMSPSTLNIQIRSDMPTYTINLNKSIIESVSELNSLMSMVSLDDAERALVSFKIRFAYSFKNLNERFYLVMARLIATSVFFYSRCLITEEWRLNSLSNDRFIEYCCEILHFEGPVKQHMLTDAVKTEALKTLASVVFLEKDKKIQLIVDNLELRNYHGFLPTQIRNCIDSLKAGRVENGSGDFSVAFVTSLFSLVYHIAGFEYGGDALNRSSLTAVLLDVVKTYTLADHHISFVTRSVRIIDNLTGMDITEFNSRDGTEIIIKRFTNEVEQCRIHMQRVRNSGGPMLCNQQRSALMKSLLNFLKRAVLDVQLATQMRRIMEADLPSALVQIIENPHYYGASLLHCSVTLATNFIYQEPAQLTQLQNKGLTDAIMGLIFNEKFPISRDLICALPNVCSALCLNERGLNELKSFNGKKPLERMFFIIFSNKFLLSMRKRKTEIVETAHILGTSFDELIRHHPTLRKEMMGIIASIIDDWLAFEQNNEQAGKRCVVTWGVGKTVVEEESSSLLPLGDYLALLGIVLETMLTNRGVQDNVQAANECGIPLRLIKLITDAKQPNPIMLQSNYLHMLANILRYVMTHRNDVNEAFVHLIKCVTSDLGAYKRCETVADANSQERLCQLTRICALLTTLNSLMKLSLHSQSSFEMRPYMLQYFATDGSAQTFICALFDAYKVIGLDRLVISCTSEQQQQTATTSQILEDTTKVRELLIDDELSQQSSLMMEVDDPTTAVSARPTNSLSAGSAGANSRTLLSASSSSQTAVDAVNQHLIERSAHSVAIRSLKQISELITYIGKTFCAVNFPRIRPRTQVAAQMDQTTMRKHAQRITVLLFDGLHRLLKTDELRSSTDKDSLGASHIHQSLSTLKKLLIDDTQNLPLLLPIFYTSGCHHTFFTMFNDYLRPNITKIEFSLTIQTWLGVMQRLISVQLLNSNSKPKTNGGQPPKQQQVIEGFEPKNYLSTCQKDAFTVLVDLFKSLVKHCETNEKEEEEEAFKQLGRVLYSLRLLVQEMMGLLELTEGMAEQSPEIPVGEIDPRKIAQLVEMGFSQSDAVDALMQHTSVPEAAEYLVSLMERSTAASRIASDPAIVVSTSSTSMFAFPTTPAVSTTAATTVAADVVAAATASAIPATTALQQNESDTMEDSQQRQRQVSAPSTSAPMETNKEQKVLNIGRSTSTATMTSMEQQKPFTDLKPLRAEDFQERISFLCEHVIAVCLNLVRRSRSVVVGLSDLLAVFANDPLARSWVDGHFIGRLIDLLNEHLDQLTNVQAVGSTTIPGGEEGGGLDEELVGQLASLMQLFCQLWRHFPDQKIYKRVEQSGTEQ